MTYEDDYQPCELETDAPVLQTITSIVFISAMALWGLITGSRFLLNKITGHKNETA